jgi:hypothetical protein
LTIHAFTELHNDYPAFVNLSAEGDAIKVSVRSRGNGGRDFASIVLTHDQAETMAEAIFKHVYAKEGEIDPASTTTESQITSGKAESIVNDAEFIRLMQDLGLECQKKGSTTRSIAKKAKAVYAHIEAVREKDREEARHFGWDSCAEANQELIHQLRDQITKAKTMCAHFKAIAERQAAGLDVLRQIRADMEAKDVLQEWWTIADELLSPAQQEPAKEAENLMPLMPRTIMDKHCFIPCPPERCDCKVGNLVAWAAQQGIKPDADHLAALALPGALPEAQAEKVLRDTGVIKEAVSATDAVTQPVKRPEDFRNMLDYANYISRLRPAIENVIKRWESPLWKQEIGTNELIKELRAAADAGPAQATPEGGISIQDLIAEHEKDTRKKAALDRARGRRATLEGGQLPDDIEELIGQYWNIAYSEGKTGISRGSEAQEVLSAMRAAVALYRAAPLQQVEEDN